MELKVEYVQGEIREGFYVQPMMKRRWAVELDMIKEIDRICSRHDIKYCGWYGTLLGAVRHQGFIPWDDDLDLAMLRADYERFQYYCGTELPDGWTISKTYPSLICVKNTDMIRLDQEFLDRYHGYPLMAGVDIFCLDYIPQDRKNEESWLEMFYAVYVLHKFWDHFEKDEQWKREKWIQLGEIEKLTGYYIDRRVSIKNQLFLFLDKIAALHREEKTGEVANVAWLYDHRKERIPGLYFEKIIKVPFEDITIPIPQAYDQICQRLYGDDYMIPVRESVHDSTREQIEILRRYFESQDKPLPGCFDMTFE